MKVLLRLDNGSLIGHIDGTIKKLSIQEAYDQGRLSDADRQRMKRLLEELQQIQEGGEAQQAGKRKGTGTEGGDPKRSKARQGNGRASSGLPGSPEDPKQGWVEKSRTILAKVMDSLGSEVVWFDRPVDKHFIPDYYQRIAHPMDLGTMKNKLETGKYKDPNTFCEDMRLVWDNCIQYNGKNTKYGHIGDRASSLFEELWAASGLDTGNRHRRHNAGVHPSKYEPQEDSEPRRAMRKQPSGRGLTTNRSLRQQEEAAILPMDRDQMRILADWMGKLEDQEVLQGAIAIIRERGLGKDASDEIELDFEKLDHETLWALDDYMGEQQKGRGGSMGKANSGFQVEPESEYESDSSDGSE